MTKWVVIVVLLFTIVSYSAFESGYDKGVADTADEFYYTLKSGQYIQLSDLLVRPQDITKVISVASRKEICEICHLSGVTSGFSMPHEYGDNTRKSTQEANNG